MAQPSAREARDERNTTRGLEVLLWGAACGRVATGAMVVAGLIAFVGLANPQQGVIAYVFLAPLALGTALIFGLLQVGAFVRGFVHIYFGRLEWGPRHRAAVVRATALMAVATVAGISSVAASMGPLSSLTPVSNTGNSGGFPPAAMVRAFVLADALAVVACAAAAFALLEVVRHFVPQRVRTWGPLFMALAVSYPLFSLVTEGMALSGPASFSPAAALWFLSIPMAAVGSYMALRMASTILDEACLRSVLEKRGDSEAAASPLGPP